MLAVELICKIEVA